MKKHNISHLVMMGDSLSDRGTLYRRKWLGFIPMRILSGLEGHSPKGRFSNGYVWSDVFSSELAEEFIIKKFEKKGLSDSDIADGVIDQDPNVDPQVHNAYSLKNDQAVRYLGEEFVRNYDEGGLTAHDYSWWPSKSITRYFSRLILATLGHKREELLNFDRSQHLSKKHKAETLVIEWSGANDLITVNERPSKEEVDRAIADRIKNVEKLMKNGYHHFVLFNLPDLSLTPRYQKKNKKEQQNAHDCSEYFNQELAKACKQLQEKYPYFSIDVFDVNTEFNELYNNPERYFFDREKRTEPYIKSQKFEINEKNHTSPGKKYMFWDDVHPTAEVQELLARKLREQIQGKYNFFPPKVEAEQEPILEISAKELCALFKTHYTKQLTQDRNSFFNCLRHSNLAINFAKTEPEEALKEILKHALYGGGNRTRSVITKLRWIDKQGHLNLNIPALKTAMAKLDEERSHSFKNSY